VVTQATDHGLPVLFDAYSPSDADQTGKFINLALAVPDSRLTALMLAGGPFAEQFLGILRKVGTDRIVLGSDFPIDDPVQAVRAVS
jgi:hypothetical protein